MLLEVFIQTSGSYTSRRLFTKLRTMHRRGQNDAKTAARLVRDEAIGFFFHAISQLANRGRSAKRQLFFFSLVMQHRGLSRNGLGLLKNMNLGLPPSTYDEELVTALTREAKNRRYCVSISP